jgi:hypothetical protein
VTIGQLARRLRQALGQGPVQPELVAHDDGGRVQCRPKVAGEPADELVQLDRVDRHRESFLRRVESIPTGRRCAGRPAGRLLRRLQTACKPGGRA